MARIALSPHPQDATFGRRSKPSRAVSLPSPELQRMGFDFDEFDEEIAAALEGEAAAVDPITAAVEGLFASPGGGMAPASGYEAAGAYNITEGDYAESAMEVLGHDLRSVIRAEVDAVMTDVVTLGGRVLVEFDPRVMEYLTDPSVAREVIDEVVNRVAVQGAREPNAEELGELEVSVAQELDGFLARGGYADRFHPVREYLESRGAPLGRDAVTGEPIQVVGLDPAADPAVAEYGTGSITQPRHNRIQQAAHLYWEGSMAEARGLAEVIAEDLDIPGVTVETVMVDVRLQAQHLSDQAFAETGQREAPVRVGLDPEVVAREVGGFGALDRDHIRGLSDSDLDWALRNARHNLMGAMAGQTYEEWQTTPAMERLLALEAEVTTRDEAENLEPTEYTQDEARELFRQQLFDEGLDPDAIDEETLSEMIDAWLVGEPDLFEQDLRRPEGDARAMSGLSDAERARMRQGPGGLIPPVVPERPGGLIPPDISELTKPGGYDIIPPMSNIIPGPEIKPPGQRGEQIWQNIPGRVPQGQGLTADQAFQMHHAMAGGGPPNWQEDLPLGDRPGRRLTPAEIAAGQAGVKTGKGILGGTIPAPPEPDVVTPPVPPEQETLFMEGLNPEARSMDSQMLQDLFAQQAAEPEPGFLDRVWDLVEDSSWQDRAIILTALVGAGLITGGTGGMGAPLGGALLGGAALATQP